MTRHYLDVDDLTVPELGKILDLADQLKAERGDAGDGRRDDLAGRSVALLLEKPSTRTRVSFEVAAVELGAHPLVLSADQLQLGRGEPLADTARVLSSYVHALVVRTFSQSRLEDLADHGTVSVINALSDYAHPCQALADLQTIREYKGTLVGLKLAYLGDGNNMAHSLVKAGAMAGMHVAVACPAGYEPIPQVIDTADEIAADTGARITVTDEPLAAAADADVVYTDVWASMGSEAEAQDRALIFRPYQVDGSVMDAARPDAIVMHCLPAHRGEEITADIFEGDQSVVWQQAANRLPTAKAVLLTVLA